MIRTTWCVDKTGFQWALSFHRFSSSLSSIFLSLSALYYPASLCIFTFFLVPLQVLNLLPLAHLSLTSHSPTPVHYEVQLRPTPQKVTFILLHSLIFQNIGIAINSFICLSMFRAVLKHALGFLIILVPGEFRFFFVAFTWKLTRCYKNRLTVSFTSKPFSPLWKRLRNLNVLLLIKVCNVFDCLY